MSPHRAGDDDAGEPMAEEDAGGLDDEHADSMRLRPKRPAVAAR
jgi:hypothetical protein